MRLALVTVLLLAAASPARAQSTGALPDTAPPSPGVVCAERDGKCDDTAVRGRDCARDAERPCTDPPPVRTGCIDRDRDRTCDGNPRPRGAGIFAAIGGAIASIWTNNVPKEKGGGRARDRDRPSTTGPNVR
jgi:hypothetical protein